MQIGEQETYPSERSDEGEPQKRTISLFALDGEGKPVTDLRQEELEVTIDGKIVRVNDFQVKPGGGRTVFLFFDGVHNTVEGRKRSVEIAVELMRQGNRSDIYYIFSFTQVEGLELREGPTRATGELIHNLEDHWVIPYPQSVDAVLDGRREQEGLSKYENHIAQLHYALRNITGTKLAFLLSEGPTGRRESRQKKTGKAGTTRRCVRDYMLSRLMETVKYGGSVLNVIDPGKRRELKDFAYLFDRTEGLFKAQYNHPVEELLMGEEENFIGAKKIDKIAAAVRVTQGAGYMLEFVMPSDIRQWLRLSVKCKRKGVLIQTPSYTAGEYTYDGMDDGLKTLFALNVADNGNWSRMTGTVRQIRCKVIETKQTQEGLQYKIEVSIPAGLRNKEADIFLVRRSKNDTHPEVTKHTRVLKENEHIEFNGQKKNHRVDVVIIEPRTVRCLKSVIRD